MDKVIKIDGRFLLQANPALTARGQKVSDGALVKKDLSSADLRGLLERILLRLEALE